jgi:hypothetical protein
MAKPPAFLPAPLRFEDHGTEENVPRNARFLHGNQGELTIA